MKKFENREVRVFISSTPQGMGNEREVLVRHVFPEIRQRCSKRGIGFTEVDLRWAITSEAVDKGLAVPICFQQIDNYQPFFIGLLGEYYGSTIPPEQIETACADYPWIQQGYLDCSITELEMLYGFFKVGQNRTAEQGQAIVKQALFYFRESNYAETLPETERQAYIETDATKRAKQQDLKLRLRQRGCQITDYEQPLDLKTLVIEPLWEKISEKFPDTLTAEQRANFEHDAFAASRQRVYIKRQSDFDRLSQHAESDAAPLIIHGESGGGKTALLANWAAEYQETHSDKLVFWHFCGCSAASTNPIGLLRRIMLNLKGYFNKWEDEIPVTPEAIIAEFGQWLAKATKPVILIIDGLNRLEETAITRSWLHSIPAKTRLFLSTISAEELPADWQRWKLALLTEKSAREALITEYLNQYGKTLAAKPMQTLLAQPKTANPLYLQVILDEIRIFGEPKKLEQRLDGYLEVGTIPALYEKVLARLEVNYQSEEFPHLVAEALSLLWAARQGLEESELLTLLKIPQAIWAPLYLALQNALVSRAGLLSFSHDYLRQAVENRYLSSVEKLQGWHLRLANYFCKQELDGRIANELPYQLHHAKGGYDSAEPLYRRALEVAEKVLGVEHPDTVQSMNNLAGLYYVKGGYDSAEPLYKRALEINEKVLGKQHPNTAQSVNNLAALLQAKGDYDSAEPLCKRALEINEKVLGKQHPNTAMSLNNLAELLRAKGDYDSAEPLYKRALEINEKVLGKRHPDTAQSMNNLASLHYAKGDYDSAEPLYERALEIYEKVLGKLHPDTAMSLNNLGLLRDAKGDCDSAEQLYKRALEVYEKVLGKQHPYTAMSLNNLGLLRQARGDYDSAELLCKRALKICEKALGKRHPDTAQSMNNLASLYYAKGGYDSAELLYKRALEIAEKVLGAEHLNTVIFRKNLEDCIEKIERTR